MSDSVQVKVVSEPQQVEGQEGSDSENETLQLALKLSKALVDDEKEKSVKTQAEGTKKQELVACKPSPLSGKFANIGASVSLDLLVAELESTLSRGHYKEQRIFNRVQMLMERYDAAPEEYSKYALRLDEGQYTRNLIRKSPYFTLMLLVWPPAITSPIHDHGGSECWLRVVSASLEERFYDKPDGHSEIRMRFRKECRAGGVCFINDEQGLHAIRNPSEKEWAVSLHCYVPGYLECNAFFDEKNADRGKKSCRLTFTSVDGVLQD